MIKCSDGEYGISLERWPAGELDGDVLLCFWYLGVQKRLTLWKRIGLAWRVFREHSIIFDELCISDENIRDVIKEFEKVLKG